MHAAGAYESICEALVPRAPDNTPANGEREASETSKAIAVAMTALSDSTSAAAIKSSVKRAAEINFDDEDEPRSSPSVRKVSGMSVKQESNNERGDHDLERRILGEIHA
ncbi:hypothetical protein M7I_3652 [Glarea lozoyensis 74030]|uniref:Uncharacterized protein n=1 Tax=Glarea lozoyensis (strain ATCC 74030 / MF5533) TaxID=1104152 RepID=H0EM26_GLAL7|nr:hypothetical protein M7I_3652 [Glarea lozoyensis 74030]